jgi:hypothetical protein
LFEAPPPLPPKPPPAAKQVLRERDDATSGLPETGRTRHDLDGVTQAAVKDEDPRRRRLDRRRRDGDWSLVMLRGWWIIKVCDTSKSKIGFNRVYQEARSIDPSSLATTIGKNDETRWRYATTNKANNKERMNDVEE